MSSEHYCSRLGPATAALSCSLGGRGLDRSQAAPSPDRGSWPAIACGRAAARARLGAMPSRRHSLALALTVAMSLPVASAAAATPGAAIVRGVVDINTRIPAQQARAAGTGMLLGASGVVLTNNHVIRGGTHIRVTVHGGHRYAATVLGTDAAKDVALLKIARLPQAAVPVTLGDSSQVAVGQTVRAIGNAGGRGGRPAVAHGRVTALHQSVTATDGAGSSSEHLKGLIQMDARMRPGDSGGPLVDGAGRVIGMDTAMATGSRAAGSPPAGFAIPINRAVAVAQQIEAGRGSTNVHIGAAAFLGVEVLSAGPLPVLGGGAVVAGVSPGSPAASAGLSAGDVITGLGGAPVGSAAGLERRLGAHHPGEAVAVTWRDPVGIPHAATVVLGSGPPA
jgi:S1-C subfamily serine protease